MHCDCGAGIRITSSQKTRRSYNLLHNCSTPQNGNPSQAAAMHGGRRPAASAAGQVGQSAPLGATAPHLAPPRPAGRGGRTSAPTESKTTKAGPWGGSWWVLTGCARFRRIEKKTGFATPPNGLMLYETGLPVRRVTTWHVASQHAAAGAPRAAGAGAHQRRPVRLQAQPGCRGPRYVSDPRCWLPPGADWGRVPRPTATHRGLAVNCAVQSRPAVSLRVPSTSGMGRNR